MRPAPGRPRLALGERNEPLDPAGRRLVPALGVRQARDRHLPRLRVRAPRPEPLDLPRPAGPGFSGVAVVALLVYLEPDFGSALHIALVAGALAFLAGVPFRLFVMGGAVVLLPVVAMGVASASYRLDRIFAFLDPWAQRQGTGYQLIQSVIAVGSGGPFGRGFMKGEQKTSFLPYPYSDFIFGVVGEELGFIGAFIIVGLFLVFLWRGLTDRPAARPTCSAGCSPPVCP